MTMQKPDKEALATDMLIGRPAPPEWPIPVVASAAWIVVFIIVALRARRIPAVDPLAKEQS